MRNPKILLIEDDIMMKTIWQSTISKTIPSAQISWVTSVEAAEKNLAADPIENYDILIVDIFLSGDKTGIDFIKQLPENFKSFVILSSGLDEELSDEFKSEHSFELNFVRKPLSVIDCEAVLKKYIESKRIINERLAYGRLSS